MFPRGLLPLFLLLSLGTVQTAAVSISSLFNVLSGGGACSDDYVTLMNSYLSDVQELSTAFANAITHASDLPDTEEGWVARGLFWSWFGIQIDVDGVVTSETEAQWEVVKDISSKMTTFLDGSGMTAPQTPPEILCDGNGFAKYSWEASILKWDSETSSYYTYEIDDEEPELSEIYDYNPDLVPYLQEDNHNYYLVKAGASDDNICEKDSGNKLYGQAFSGQQETTKTYLASPVHMPAISPLILMCPATLAQTSLADIITASADYDLGVTQISSLTSRARGPTTLFHELIHLISYWTETDSGDFSFNQDEYVTDYTYDVDQCLWMAFGQVNVEVPQEDGSTVERTFTSSDTVRNAESYTFFALAFWYYIETGETFYTGLLSTWDAPFNGGDAAGSDVGSDTGSAKRSAKPHHYGQWLGHSHSKRY
ncbi:uncharacterized protein N7503_001776 [Penicillium pulvis]|uniref:uncharacterized protein n=1 Tax=Penicillium pulvis TaxID=1562058 RepID=UPI002548088D|nr:uncharacterized protein N7503_001776 [Penicillium pulvis]KAJ5809558.1 hypothetical protein N7503_001776 [Penicillium pulvis]